MKLRFWEKEKKIEIPTPVKKTASDYAIEIKALFEEYYYSECHKQLQSFRAQWHELEMKRRENNPVEINKIVEESRKSEEYFHNWNTAYSEMDRLEKQEHPRAEEIYKAIYMARLMNRWIRIGNKGLYAGNLKGYGKVYNDYLLISDWNDPMPQPSDRASMNGKFRNLESVEIRIHV
jgi:hypothetical protein